MLAGTPQLVDLAGCSEMGAAARSRADVDDRCVVAKFRLRAAMRDGLANVRAKVEPRGTVGPMAGDSCGTTSLTTPSCSADAAASSAKLHIQHWLIPFEPVGSLLREGFCWRWLPSFEKIVSAVPLLLATASLICIISRSNLLSASSSLPLLLLVLLLDRCSWTSCGRLYRCDGLMRWMKPATFRPTNPLHSGTSAFAKSSSKRGATPDRKKAHVQFSCS